MGMNKNEYKKHDGVEDNSGIENELDDEDIIDGMHQVVANANFDELDEDANDSYDDGDDSDYSYNDNLPFYEDYKDSDYEYDEGNESDNSSIRSLAAGRENIQEDDLIKMIKNSKNIKKQQPPDIMNDDVVTNISFSPTSDIIAVATMEGDVCLYNYDLEKTELILKYSAHVGCCREIEYDETGELLYSISRDRCIIVADSNDGKFKHVYNNAHENGIYSLSIINKNLFCTGDEFGIMKLWDLRKKEEVFSQKISNEYISSLRTVEKNSILACTSGDGSVSGVNMNTRKIISKSEPYSAEFTCSGIYCSDSKLAVGTSIGSLLLFNWGTFVEWNDEFPGLDKQKHAVNCMIPITENIAITGLDNGSIRATHLFPMRHVGIVGQHGSTVECLDVNKDGTLLASCSIENKVCFWNVEYFEDIQITDKNKTDNKRAREHNLPSSNGVNASNFFAGLA